MATHNSRVPVKRAAGTSGRAAGNVGCNELAVHHSDFRCACCEPLEVFLCPGEIVLAERPVVVTTVLGSCVAITLTVVELGIGAICHAVLPEQGHSLEDNRGSTNTMLQLRYVDRALLEMLSFVRRHGSSREQVVVKLFGGAEMFAATAVENRSALAIGGQNIAQALRCLGAAGLKPAARDVGGSHGRKLIYRSISGDVFVKKVSRDFYADRYAG